LSYTGKGGRTLIVIDYRDRKPIYEQIVEKFQMLIIKGVLEPDTQMPSVRSLATELSINPNTIQKAYSLLEQQGFIYPVKGRGNFVSGNQALVEQRKNIFLQKLKTLIKEGKEIGISKEMCVEKTAEFYEEVEA
jgi:GntR family transcriptional regulator